jgi:hypothetical protein
VVDDIANAGIVPDEGDAEAESLDVPQPGIEEELRNLRAEQARIDLIQQVWQDPEMQRLKDEMLEQALRKKSGNVNGKAVAAFVVFAAVCFAAWQLYLRADIFGADPAAWWMKVAFFGVYLIAFIASLRSINALKNNPGMNAGATTFMRIRVVGTAPMIFFRAFIISTMFPAVLFLILSLALGELTPFWRHFFSIYVFCWIIGLVSFAFQSSFSALSVGHLSWAQLKRKKGAMVGTTLVGILSVPAIVLFLHWHFGWFPMKTWIAVVLIIFFAFGMISVAAVGRQNASELQNEPQ